MSRPATGCEAIMLFDYILGSLVTLVIMAYLVYALIRPERF
jgi:K+-transporting ATPase KdpF subunit